MATPIRINPAPLFTWGRPPGPARGGTASGLHQLAPHRLVFSSSLVLHHWELHTLLSSHHGLPNSPPSPPLFAHRGGGSQGPGGTSAPCRVWGLQAPPETPAQPGTTSSAPAPGAIPAPCWPCPEGTSCAWCWPHHTQPEQLCQRSEQLAHPLLSASRHCTVCIRTQGPISSPCPEAQNVQMALLPQTELLILCRNAAPSPKGSHNKYSEPRFAWKVEES